MSAASGLPQKYCSKGSQIFADFRSAARLNWFLDPLEMGNETFYL